VRLRTRTLPPRSTASSTCARALAGEVVNPGTTIVTLINPDDLWIRADVEETYVEKIRAGDKVTVRTPSGRVRDCEVFFRGVDADYATQRDV
jgi:multidrug resistance efflux pump